MPKKSLIDFFTKKPPTAGGQQFAVQQIHKLKTKRLLPSLAQWRALPQFLNRREQLVALICAVAMGLSGLSLAGVFLSTRLTTVPAAGGAYTEGVIGFLHTVNPLYAERGSVDDDLCALIFSSLLKVSPQTGEFAPDLAQSYSVSDDGLTYTFTMASGATWHDGEQVTASDVAFTIHAVQDPHYHSPLASRYSDVTVEATDDHTVVFHLSKPSHHFLSLLTIGILPEHLWSTIDPQNAPYAALNSTPIGSGPYELDKTRKSSDGTILQLTLKRNDSYFHTPGYLDSLIIKLFSSPTELETALQSHAVEGSLSLPYTLAHSFGDDPGVTTVASESPRFVAAFFATDAGPTAKATVRAALALAVDRRELDREAFAGTFAMSTQVEPADWALTDQKMLPVADTIAAQAALGKEGYTLGADGKLVDAKGKPLAFDLVALDEPRLKNAADYLEKTWTALGVTVNKHIVDKATLQSDVLPKRQFGVLLVALGGEVRVDPTPFWGSAQLPPTGLNVSGLHSADVDAALVALDKTVDDKAYTEARAKLDALLNASTPAIFLYRLPYIYITRSALHGIALPFLASPADRFAEVTSWYKNTRWVLK